MTAITTVAELDALPVGAEVADKDDDRWRKVRVERWEMIGAPQAPVEETAFVTAYYAPFRLLQASPLALAESPDLHMTKCVHDACLTTTPLPPGSSWACSNHNIALGGS